MRSSNGYLVRTSRDPFTSLFGRDVDTLVRGAFATPSTGRQVGFNPAVESRREGDDAVIRLELPGVDVARDVTVEVKGRVLVVSGERRDERESEPTEGRHLSEFRYGGFRRTFRLGPQVSPDAVSASYDAGVLTVRVAGAFAEAEGHQVEITTHRPESGEVVEG